MIPGDEDKPMTVLEYISDVPREPLPYIDYLLNYHKEHLEYWKSLNNEHIIIKIRGYIFELEDLKMKLERFEKERLDHLLEVVHEELTLGGGPLTDDEADHCVDAIRKHYPMRT